MGSPVLPEDLPGFGRLWAQLGVQLFLNEFLFYWGHRLLHTRPLYMAIHKQHHGFIGTRSFAGEYAHVAEDVLTAYIPFLIGLVATRAHFHTVFFWFFIRLWAVAEHHSGYCFRAPSGMVRWLGLIGLLEPEQAANHDYHHTHNCGNFGHPCYDFLFGTMDAYVVAGREKGYAKGQ